MPLFLCDREFVSDQRWRVDMNEFYEELKKVLDLSDGDVWTETVLCGKDAGKKRILSGIFAQDEEQNERPDEKKKENREKRGRVVLQVIVIRRRQSNRQITREGGIL